MEKFCLYLLAEIFLDIKTQKIKEQKENRIQDKNNTRHSISSPVSTLS